jgi:hypothetical protein
MIEWWRSGVKTATGASQCGSRLTQASSTRPGIGNSVPGLVLPHAPAPGAPSAVARPLPLGIVTNCPSSDICCDTGLAEGPRRRA